MALAPTKQHNTIRTFALVCVAVTSVFVMGMRIWGTQLLTSKDWCDRAIGAAEDIKAAGRSIEAIRACFELLNKQVDRLGFNSHIDTGTIGLCLAALMVIVVAGGKLNFSGSTKGVSGSIGPAGEQLSDRAEGALETAHAAEARAEEIVQEDAPPAAATPAHKPKPTEILE